MGSRYSIIQYVPNLIADERINIGVLVFDDTLVRVKFLTKWNRVQHFELTDDILFLRDFAHQMQKAAEAELLFPGDQPNDLPKHERLIKVARGWMNSIQFTEPRASLEDVENLLEDAVRTYLVEPPVKEKKLRDRTAAAQIATSNVRRVLKQQYGDNKARELLKVDALLKGSRLEHKFDVTVANGRPFFVAHGISFEVQTPEQTVGDLAFKIIDVKESKPNLPLAVVVLPPTQGTSDRGRLERVYQQTIATYKDLGANVLKEDQVEPWVSECLANTKA
jgi:hypothetical protein